MPVVRLRGRARARARSAARAHCRRMPRRPGGSMSEPARSQVIRLAEARAAIPGPAGEHAVSLLQRGTLKAMLSLGRFAPLPRPTTPHAQDEVYIVVRGRGVFFHDGKREP